MSRRKSKARAQKRAKEKDLLVKRERKVAEKRLGEVGLDLSRAEPMTLAEAEALGLVREALCIHEAGHAVAGELLGERVEHVGVDRRSGHVRGRNPPEAPEDRILIQLAGMAAEMLELGGVQPIGKRGDIDGAKAIAEAARLPFDGTAAMGRAIEFLRPHIPAVLRVARALQRHGELERTAFLQAMGPIDPAE